ncbi:MAG: hypothetical protein IKM59_05570 [Oscillospiraceae bacterium]|nr:hypothetical protein [Oscillospiraceae bacterium]
MELSESKQREFVRRLLLSRMRLLSTHGFYGLLLMHMGFSLSEDIGTAATDGKRIYFSPVFLEELSEEELDFVLLHEVLHAALRHCARGKGKDNECFNIACDIVVNSTILQENHMDRSTITLRKYGEAMHLAPNGEEGFRYSAEEVYEMLMDPGKIKKPLIGTGNGSGRDSLRGKGLRGKGSAGSDRFGQEQYRDDHSLWAEETDPEQWEIWTARVVQAARAVEIRDPSNNRGLIPAFAKRILRELTRPQIDWRTVLNEFIQPEINDYSFSPPDRRVGDSPFFLPDYNEMGEGNEVFDILFMVDTSGSVSDDMLTAAISEIRGAIDQFQGRLRGWLGYFDAAVTPPVAFENREDILKIHPYGGGGTDFRCVFQFVATAMKDRPPAYIVILTDGCAPFPPESMARGIPVLWLLNNDMVDPPWGKVARISM